MCQSPGGSGTVLSRCTVWGGLFQHKNNTSLKKMYVSNVSVFRNFQLYTFNYILGRGDTWIFRKPIISILFTDRKPYIPCLGANSKLIMTCMYIQLHHFIHNVLVICNLITMKKLLTHTVLRWQLPVCNGYRGRYSSSLPEVRCYGALIHCHGRTDYNSNEKV